MRAKPNTRNGRNVKSNNSSNNNSNNSGKLSVKKPLKENVSTSNQPDNSVLRPPVDTSIAGLKQAVKLFETGTPEVLHLLSFECDVIYECRVCRNLFRSLANFISHKRVYCTQRFNHVRSSPVVEDHTILLEEKSGENCLTLPSRITARQDLTTIMQTSAAQYYKEVEDKLSSRDINRCDATIHLQPIESTSFGVYQTVGKKDGEKLIKNQVSELNRIISTNEEVVLGPDGKIIRQGSTNDDQTLADEHIIVDDLICSLCKVKFSSKKTLSHHTKTVHESFRVCYSCPCCKNLFSNTWSVHRHLYKVHRKSNEQVRRLRAQIQKKQVRAEKLAEKFNRKSADSNKSKKEDNKVWMEHFEDDSELQRCGGCGRRFERRAALTAHAQICYKRISACNSLQSTKRKDEKTSEAHSDSVSVPVKQQTSSQGSPMQKVQIEKRIGIQVRMNYCKNAVGSTGMETRRSERHKSCEEKDDDAFEHPSLDSILKDRLLGRSTESINKVKHDDLRGPEDKYNSCNSSVDGETNVHTSGKRTSSSKKFNKSDSKVKSKRLENMCTQLRKAAGLELEGHENSSKSSALSNSDGINRDEEDIKTECTKEKDNQQNDSGTDLTENNFVKSESVVLNNLTSKKSIASSSKDSFDPSIDSYCPETGSREDKYSSEVFNSDLNEESNCAHTLSSENLVNESDSLLENSKKIVLDKDNVNEADCVPLCDSKSKIEEIHAENLPGTVEKDSENNSVGILTRYKVRSIFKSDSSIIDNTTNEVSDQEELNIADESSLKENLNETHSDDQSHWMQKKMSQYIRYKNKQCLICLKKFKMLMHIKQHVADHLGWNNYHCLYSNCTFATFSKSDCIRHLMKTHLKPHEKNRAPSLVGELGQVKSDSCDIDVKCNLKNLHKRKKLDSEDFCVQQTVLKESVDSDFKMLDKDNVTVVSINEDSSEILAEECVHTSKMDSSCSEQSDIESKIKKKFKRRKVDNYEKHNPPVRKCSPDSTTELTEKDLKTAAVGAQFRNEVELPEIIVINESGDESTSFTKLEERCKEYNKNRVCNIPDRMIKTMEQSLNPESIDSDSQRKGRDTEEEDETQDITVENNMDAGNLRRMVMEIILGDSSLLIE